MTSYRREGDSRTPTASADAETSDSAKTTRRAPRRKPVRTYELQTFGAVKLRDLLVPRLVGRFRFCRELGWLQFTGAKWATENAEGAVFNELVATIKDYTRTLLDGVPMLSKEQCQEIAGLSSASTQNQAVKLARSAGGVATLIAEFDPQPLPGQPWKVPAANGKTIELWPEGRQSVRATRPDDMNTHTVCAYEPKARASRVGKALKDYQPDEDVRRFMLQQWARGLSGMGSETFTVNLGERGGNGKSTMQGLLTEVAGDYAVELPVEVILKGNGSAREVYRSELAAMRGARLVFTDEPEEGARYNLGMLKKITGGGTVQGRAMGREAVTFVAHILFQMACNVRPSWSADGGMERRYIEIAWNFEVGKEKVRESFKEELRAEASGFLNEILKHWTGAAPLDIPAVIQGQTALGSKESSPAARFADEALERVDAETVSGRAMYEAFSEWSKQNGMRPISSTKLGRELSRLGFDKEKKGLVRYASVRVRDEYIPRSMF
jgi:putative DNA primase/helicase